MNPNQIIEQTTSKLQNAVEHFQDELKKLRTGRAHPSMLDGLMIEAYGTQMPLIQVGSVSTPEPQLLQITPFDPGNLQAITTAVRNNQSLGLNPVDDGHVIRLQIPPLTEDRRKEFVKILGTKVEDTMVSMRNIRHDVIKEFEQAKKDKDISEDDFSRLQKQIDELMAQQKSVVESLQASKEKEILTI